MPEHDLPWLEPSPYLSGGRVLPMATARPAPPRSPLSYRFRPASSLVHASVCTARPWLHRDLRSPAARSGTNLRFRLAPPCEPRGLCGGARRYSAEPSPQACVDNEDQRTAATW